MASLKPLLSILEFLHTDISLYIPSVTATSKNRNFRSKKQVVQKWTLLEKPPKHETSFLYNSRFSNRGEWEMEETQQKIVQILVTLRFQFALKDM